MNHCNEKIQEMKEKSEAAIMRLQMQLEMDEVVQNPVQFGAPVSLMDWPSNMNGESHETQQRLSRAEGELHKLHRSFDQELNIVTRLERQMKTAMAEHSEEYVKTK